MTEGAEYYNRIDTYRYNSVSKPFKDDFKRVKYLVENFPEGVYQRSAVVHRTLKGNLEKALGNMSIEDFRKLKSGEWGASQVIRDAVKKYFKIDLPEKYAKQPEIIVMAKSEENQSLDKF